MSLSDCSKTISYFGGGPAKIANKVLKETQNDVLQFDNTYVSILELSHRSEAYTKVNQEALDLLRETLKVPSNYKILFLPAGAQCQFSGVPLNLMKTGEADYIVTGAWSGKAATEAEKYGKVNLVFPKSDAKHSIPPEDTWQYSKDASYVYFCSNETIEGIEFNFVPKVPDDVPLVCDMTSNICSRPVDVAKYGVIFGSGQKNIGCAGVTVIIVREDLIGFANKMCPSVLNYAVQLKANSIYNTPPVFAINLLRRVLIWTKECGGCERMDELSQRKSNMLYQLIDSSNSFYNCPVVSSCRSRMNAVFRIGSEKGDETLEKTFLTEATSEGLLSLKGHRSVGGIRASLYNAVSEKDVERLCNFMKKFQENYGPK